MVDVYVYTETEDCKMGDDAISGTLTVYGKVVSTVSFSYYILENLTFGPEYISL